MSRTFRCKNYEQENNTSWDRQGRKTSLFGAERIGRYYETPPLFREPTREEFFQQFYNFHGESSSGNSRSPGKWYRQNRMKENRSINKREIIKFMKDADYEVMVENNPRNCWWDWS